LLKAIIRGKREVIIPGTPKKYSKIYMECWQHDQRPTIQSVSNDLNNIVYNDLFDIEESCIESNDNIEHKQKPTIELEDSNSTDVLQQHTNLYKDINEELKLMSSIVTTLEKSLNEDIKSELFEDHYMPILPAKPSQKPSKQIANNNEQQQFLYDLNKLFMVQFNIQGVSKGTSSSIVYWIEKYIDENDKNPNEILQAADDFCFTANDSLNNQSHFYDLLKENQFIGLISLGSLYRLGKGIAVNQQKALQLFLKSVARGSTLGKCYVGDCYYFGHGVIEDKIQSFY
ncbi:7050_t:CDS:2, partial [Racocetra persica]